MEVKVRLHGGGGIEEQKVFMLERKWGMLAHTYGVW